MATLYEWIIENSLRFNLITSYSPAIPLAFGLIRFANLSLAQRLLWIAIAINLGANWLSTWVITSGIMDNRYPIWHIRTVLDYCLLVSVFYFGVKGMISRQRIHLLIASFIAIEGISLIFFQNIWEINSIASTSEAIILIFLSLWYFWYTLDQLNTPELGKSFAFWFAISILLFFVANLLSFIFFNFIFETEFAKAKGEYRIPRLVMGLFNLVNILQHLLYSIALLCKEPKPSHKFSSLAP